MQKIKKLIINADDYGISLPVSRGIIETAAQGAVRSTTVMTNTQEFPESIEQLKKSATNIDVGWHANLTYGKPVLDPKDVPSLVSKDGEFFPKHILLLKIMLGSVSNNEIQRELRAQYLRLTSHFPQISHIDGHHHVHIFPIVRDVVEKLGLEFNIRAVRSPREGFWTSGFKAVFKKIAVMLFKASAPKYWRERGFITADYFAGFFLGAGKNMKANWTSVLKKLRPGITEIMVHPGYESEIKDKYNKDREVELKLFKNHDFICALKSSGIELSSYRELIL